MKQLLFSLSLLCSTLSFAQSYSKVKIHTDAAGLQTLSELGLAVDHGEYKVGSFFIGDLSASEIQTLEANGFEYEIVVPDVKAWYAAQNTLSGKNVTCDNQANTYTVETPQNFYMNSTYAGFYRYQDMLDALDSMAAMYPNLITVRAPISTFLTHENRPIYYVKISDSPGTDDSSEPNVLYTAIHHAREPMSMSEVIFYMWHLLENYATDPEIQYIVDNNELFFVPCINPDGYIYNETTDPSGFGMHRKNKAPVGSTNPGVDLNRNYSYGWNTTGVSSNVNNDTYPGTGPFSEPETQAIRWLVETYGFKTALNAHSYGNQLLFPIGTTTNEFADHHDYFQDLSSHMVTYNGYEAIKSSGLYPASGDSDDYMYKDSLGIGMHDTIFVMTPETGTDFWPAQNEVMPTCAGMVFPNMRMAHVTHKYLVTSETDDPMISSTSGYFHHEVLRLGFESGGVDVSIDPLTNIQSVGSAVTYDINWHTTDNDSISFVLSPTIQFGDEVSYVLVTDYGAWQQRDTITKIYDQWSLVQSDDASSAANWTGTWSLTTDDSYSPTASFTESDGGDYSNNADEKYTFTQTIDLSNADNAMITFFAKWDIEADYDYCQFQVSIDGGSSWIGQCGLYTVEGSSSPWNGSAQPDGEPVWEGSSDWVQEQISLSDYVGNALQVRFRFGSDGGLTKDGFYFDDFNVLIDYTVDVESNELIKLVAAPNPVNDVLVISAPVALNGALQLVDQTGKVVYEDTNLYGAKQVSIPTAQLPEGIYFARINGGMKPVKVVVKH